MAYINLSQNQIDSVIQAINTKAKLSGAAFTGPVSGTTFIGSFIGNANTATLANAAVKLATARKINGVAFDGTSDIIVVDSTKSASLTSYAFIATANQTTFTVSGTTLSATPLVFLNGALQQITATYTVSNLTVTFLNARTALESIVIVG
jgi:hypothetical protein